ncbi:MAG: YdcF family protein, partial [Verrucomicrobiia bacterium]
HMPRAMAMARRAGINAIACPADYRTASPAPRLIDWVQFDLEAYQTTSRAILEYVGLLWASLRGQS